MFHVRGSLAISDAVELSCSIACLLTVLRHAAVGATQSMVLKLRDSPLDSPGDEKLVCSSVRSISNTGFLQAVG